MTQETERLQQMLADLAKRPRPEHKQVSTKPNNHLMPNNPIDSNQVDVETEYHRWQDIHNQFPE